MPKVKMKEDQIDDKKEKPIKKGRATRNDIKKDFVASNDNENVKCTEFVIKSALRKQLLTNKVDLVINAIKQRVKVVTLRYKNASILFAGFIKHIFNGKDDVNTVFFSDSLFTETIIRAFLLGVENKKIELPDKRMTEYLEDENNKKLIISTSNDPLYMRNIYTDIAGKYVTNIENYFTTTLEPRILKHCKQFRKLHKFSDVERRHMISQILNRRWSGGDIVVREVVFNEINKIKTILNNFNIDIKTNEYWIKRNYPRIIRLYVYISRFNELNGFKTFNIVPIASNTAKFIGIDTFSLFGILKELKIVTCNEQQFRLEADQYWKRFLNIYKLKSKRQQDELKNIRFTNRIDTDGIALCTHFMKLVKKEKPIKVTKSFLKGKRVLGCDPGRENIVYMVEKLDDNKVRTFVLKRSQYYEESGINEINRKSKIWNRGIKNVIEDFKTVSSKSINCNNHQSFVNMYLNHSEQLWNEKLKPRWSRLHLTAYGGKKKTLERFCNSIKDADRSKDVVVIYGSAKFKPGGSGEVSVPTNQVFKTISKNFFTKLVSEYRTTMVYHKDDSILNTVAYKENIKQSVRGLLWCTKTPGVSNSNISRPHFVNRDKNAALNILRCAIDSQRPLSLTPTDDKVKIVKTVGKQIRKVDLPKRKKECIEAVKN